MSTTVAAAAARQAHQHAEPPKAALAKHEAPHHEAASKPAAHVGKKVDVKA